jgi:ketosteroid isomerase-like protein
VRRDQIEAFYAALFAKDSDAVAAMIGEHFAPDAVLHRPESLPGGGRTEGADRIARFMVGATKMPAGGPLDIGTMRIASIIDGGDVVAVELAFPFAGVDTGALEVWTLKDGRVTSIRAFYWDTAAMLKAATG